MRKYTSILFLTLYSFALCQDVYPYFSDAKKQLEFEKNRIYITEVKETEMVISNDHQFNYAYIFNKNQPAIITGIKTDYVYRYKFEIKIGNSVVSDIDLLSFMGLEEEASKIIKDYNDQLENYIPKYKIKKTDTILSFILKLTGGTLIAYNLLMAAVQTSDDAVSEREKVMSRASAAYGIGAGFTVYYSGIWFMNKTSEIQNPFVYSQAYSDNQLKSLAESYNKKLYKEIKNK